MDVLVTGGDTDLGRTIAEGFRDAGHQVVIAGARRDDLEVAAKELDVDAIVFDNTDPASLEEARGASSPTTWTPSSTCPPRAGTPATRAPTRCPTWPRHGATRWTPPLLVRGADRAGPRRPPALRRLDRQRRPREPARRQRRGGDQGRVSDWTAGQATHFGIRGITVNAVASGRSAEPGYDGLSRTPPSVADEITRLALFLTTPAGPPHHRPDAARQPGRAGQLRLIFPGSPRAKRGDRPA